MRTVRSLPWGCLCPGECLCLGVSVREPPPSCGQTDACENITLPQISFAGGNKMQYLVANCYFLQQI